jgi:hypothetical protein
MRPISETCAECVTDRHALDAWREWGGELPKQRCSQDHREPCIRCKKKTEVNKHGICAGCLTRQTPELKAYFRKLKAGEVS